MEDHLIAALKNLARSNPTDDIGSIYENYMGESVWEESPEDIYTFLMIASAIGFEAEPDDILEFSNMRYDDDGYSQAGSCMEAAEVLFVGLHDIPKDFEKGKSFLEFLNENFAHFFADHLSEELSRMFSLLDPKECVLLKKEFPALADV